MNKKTYPPDVIEQAQSVCKALNQIRGTAIEGETALSITEAINQVIGTTEVIETISGAETILNHLQHQRDEQLETLWEKIERARANIKANFGENSYEYELVGGKCSCKRKHTVQDLTPLTN